MKGSHTTTTTLRLAVIVGSTREGRAGEPIAAWFAALAKDHGDFTVDVLDLAGFDFPARLPGEATPEMARFTTAVDHAEAYVVVTPEYNRSFPASLKQAVDYGYDEWHGKPVGFVSYGYRHRGLFAVEQLRTVYAELHTVTVRDGVHLDLLDPDGGVSRPEAGQSAARMLAQLSWWGHALREGRAARPFTC
ncbi:NADPH-dependent FMN reductase [Phytomonospora endophytica]|uniref:NAD(P)H-dependent FMN reductase n=1 Tax=Phytomonospora endophytica TaxID=714109 RepID=A0A841FPE3_9ACTN|nr:NAD(P)H-dependent oxidoreductase [Phytomonospora endophytica]MBB6034449.1 NAD(P)H-dependent FMN reductase [Phytomonospora endophytica]GIG66843.1 FMN reductase [Phytomonospora endophytica]